MITSQISNFKSQNHNANGKSTNVKVRAYEFSLQIITFVNQLPNQRGFWAIADQLMRSATSIEANMIEAQASSSKRDFIRFYEIALKSANETKYWLSLLRDSYDDFSERSDNLLREVTEISNMLGSSILTLKGKNKI